MTTLTVIQKPSKKKVHIEIDLDRWERIAADLGLFRREFLESVNRAEQEIARGKMKRLRSLATLRKS
jgi:hypothetical protein